MAELSLQMRQGDWSTSHIRVEYNQVDPRMIQHLGEHLQQQPDKHRFLKGPTECLYD